MYFVATLLLSLLVCITIWIFAQAQRPWKGRQENHLSVEITLPKSPNHLTAIDCWRLAFAALAKHISILPDYRRHLARSVTSKQIFDLPEIHCKGTIRINDDDLCRFRDALGTRRGDSVQDLNPFFLVGITVPLSIAILANHACPIKPLGAVNTRNVVQFRDPKLCQDAVLLRSAADSNRLLYSASFGGSEHPGYRRKRGAEFCITISVYLGQNKIMDQENWFMQFLPTSFEPRYEPASDVKSKTASDPNIPLEDSKGGPMSIHLDHPRKWASFCKDYNPIHVSRVGAKILGFRSVIAHGNHIAALAFQRLVEDAKSNKSAQADACPSIWASYKPFKLDLEFLRPMMLPATSNIRWAEWKGGLEFAVMKSGKLCVTGRYSPDTLVHGSPEVGSNGTRALLMLGQAEPDLWSGCDQENTERPVASHSIGQSLTNAEDRNEVEDERGDTETSIPYPIAQSCMAIMGTTSMEAPSAIRLLKLIRFVIRGYGTSQAIISHEVVDRNNGTLDLCRMSRTKTDIVSRAYAMCGQAVSVEAQHSLQAKQSRMSHREISETRRPNTCGRVWLGPYMVLRLHGGANRPEALMSHQIMEPRTARRPLKESSSSCSRTLRYIYPLPLLLTVLPSGPCEFWLLPFTSAGILTAAAILFLQVRILLKMVTSPIRDHFIHHIFLPPKLPQKETTFSRCDDALLQLTLEAVDAMKLLVPEGTEHLDVISHMISNSRFAHTADGIVNEERLLKLLRQLVKQENPIALHISAQNAGVLISKIEGNIAFEVFELSPPNSVVYSTSGRLRRTFPGCAVSIDAAIFLEDGFQAAVAHTLSRMSQQEADGMQPQVKKTGKAVDEDRDTTNPALVTELFVSFLKAAGSSIDSLSISKSTREEVLWDDARSPWRRSPLWLLLRVSLQMTFVRLSATREGGYRLYKNFMVFLMSRVLKQPKSSLPISSDLIFVMQAKVARRLLKLGSSGNRAIMNTVQQTLTDVAESLEARWSSLQPGRQIKLSPISSLDFAGDSLIIIDALDEHIRSIEKRQPTLGTDEFRPISGLLRFHPNELPNLSGRQNREYINLNLYTFESWIFLHMADWIEQFKFEVTTCAQLQSLVVSYHRLAIPQYSGQPESISMMLLTIMHIWMACDISAVSLCPLLAQYKPALSFDFAQNLLLPSKLQMERLRVLEQYLENRLARASYPAAGVFVDVNTSDTFAARFVDDSAEHQALHRKILNQAEQDRREKLAELDRLKAQYERLMQFHRESSCQYITVMERNVFDDEIERQEHKPSCQKCDYASRARKMRINIHEWPLPEAAAAQKAIVFELQVPQFIIAWRNNVMFFLHDVLDAKYSFKTSGRAAYHLSTDRQLSSSFSGAHYAPRLSMLSEIKPHSQTHRNSHVVSTVTKNDICLPCGLQYRYYDKHLDCFTQSIKFMETIPHACTYKLPERSNKLQQFLYRPAHLANGQAPNVVIASQADCPDHMSLQEYKALSSIPCGYYLQWLNIVLQLGFPAVSFKNEETTLLMLQCIYQAGPPASDNNLRAGHACLANDSFATKLLAELNTALQRIKENWESSQALSIFISIAARLLSLNAAVDIQDACLNFLSDARMIAMNWVHELRKKVQYIEAHERRNEYLSKRAEIALICMDSFNVDSEQLEKILYSSAQASILMQCTMAAQESKLMLSSSPDLTISCLLSRQQRLLLRCYHKLTSDQAALNDCVSKSWVGFKSGSPWNTVTSDHWVETIVQGEDTGETSTVHFDVLNGELLVNGLPLDRLPLSYESHPDYKTLFGKTAIEVIPTQSAGMKFAARQEFAGYELKFGMDTTRNYLLVQAIKEGNTYEYIAPDLIRSAFPAAFTRDYVHWYDKTHDRVEFRSIKKPWDSSALGNWRLTRCQTSSAWSFTKDEDATASLLSPASASAHVLCGLLSSLADPTNVHIMLHSVSGLVEIDIPGLQLGFYLESGRTEVRSRDFPKMVLDQDQSLGTLVGLQNMLILKQARGNRIALVLDGPVSFDRTGDGNHVTVQIEKRTSGIVHTFEIDQRLGRLVDNGSVQSKLMLAYLHALTSHCLPDPLTRRTGTEQALSILSSASLRSFDRLTADNLSLLSKIAALSPQRQYYPQNKTVMQNIQWSSCLGFLSQNATLRTSVQLIIDQAKTTSDIFYPDSMFEAPTIDESNPDLIRREHVRNAMFRVSEFGAETYTTAHDVTYAGRDRGQDSIEAFQAFVMSAFVFQRKQNLDSKLPSGMAGYMWTTFSRACHMCAPDEAMDLSKIKYDAAALPGEHDYAFLPHWVPLVRNLRLRANRYSVMIWLSTLAFSKTGKFDVALLQVLALAFTREDLCQLTPPPSSIPYQLSVGKTCEETVLRGITKNLLVNLKNSPDFFLPQRSHESKQAYNNRRQFSYNTKSETIIRTVSGLLTAQWPCEEPTKPNLDFIPNVSSYLDIDQVMTAATLTFEVRFRNLNFFHYLQEIETCLSGLSVISINPPHRDSSAASSDERRFSPYISIQDLFALDAPRLLHSAPDHIRLPISSNRRVSSTLRLTGLIKDLRVSAAQSRYENAYVNLLESSADQLRDSIDPYDVDFDGIDQLHIEEHLQRCKAYAENIFQALFTATTPGSSSRLDHAIPVWTARLWPRLSPTFFLQQLSFQRWRLLSKSWRNAIVQYALALTEVQRIERLSRMVSAGSKVDLVNELRNIGHTNWDPHEYPDSLLLEVESGILIREVQEQIAGHMRNPQCGSNTVVQLNMGEGKSSLIVPIVAATLADTKKLVRVIVAKPQSKQMAQMMIVKLGGLLGRRVYYMPFSRALKVSPASADGIHQLLRECMSTGGILLVQPEHLLSFKLMGLESLIEGENAVGNSMVRSQDFCDQYSRDLVDESDENFSVKFELIYTIGKQKAVDLSPERWSCIHEILGMFRDYSYSTSLMFPDSIEIKHCSPGQFPRTRILKEDAQNELFRRITEQICDTGLGSFPIARQTQNVRKAVLLYITKMDLSQVEIEQVESTGASGFWTESTKGILLLLRGLFAAGVLSFVFSQKRWRVNYGLDATRNPSTKLAVPYRAKDCPSPRSEFSHPDVIITLTTLCYYYEGLQEADLAASFDHLLKSDQADIAYQSWIKDADRMPISFSQLQGVNLRDSHQFSTELFPRLRYSKAVVDYFLAHIVFAKEMKEFPFKLSASGWDIGKQKAFPTTGFSGTNDSRTVLPLHVTQMDLPEQKHTNALVLEYLLRPNNDVAHIPAAAGARTTDADRLLDMVMALDPPARVILDVGAQILEMSNKEVATAWLAKHKEEVQAVVYVNEHDELSVVNRKGQSEALQTSPFTTQLGSCLIFLDESHTRGIDLRLPEHYRAAVTLGANLTKDRLVQGMFSALEAWQLCHEAAQC
nr:hypothetical protein CFP56_00327 [Quercus suber]